MDSPSDEDANQEIIITLSKKTKSTPAKKPEDKYTLPKNLMILLQQLDQCLEN